MDRLKHRRTVLMLLFQDVVSDYSCGWHIFTKPLYQSMKPVTYKVFVTHCCPSTAICNLMLEVVNREESWPSSQLLMVRILLHSPPHSLVCVRVVTYLQSPLIVRWIACWSVLCRRFFKCRTALLVGCPTDLDSVDGVLFSGVCVTNEGVIRIQKGTVYIHKLQTSLVQTGHPFIVERHGVWGGLSYCMDRKRPIRAKLLSIFDDWCMRSIARVQWNYWG